MNDEYSSTETLISSLSIPRYLIKHKWGLMFGVVTLFQFCETGPKASK